MIETSDGLRWWLTHREGFRDRLHAIGKYGPGIFDYFMNCHVIARDVYDIREAMRLMGEDHE